MQEISWWGHLSPEVQMHLSCPTRGSAPDTGAVKDSSVDKGDTTVPGTQSNSVFT